MARRERKASLGTTTVSNLMETSYERSFFEMSLKMITVHREWVKQYPHTRSRLEAALHHLDELMDKYEELRFNGMAIETKKVLKSKLALWKSLKTV